MKIDRLRSHILPTLRQLVYHAVTTCAFGGLVGAVYYLFILTGYKLGFSLSEELGGYKETDWSGTFYLLFLQKWYADDIDSLPTYSALIAWAAATPFESARLLAPKSVKWWAYPITGLLVSLWLLVLVQWSVAQSIHPYMKAGGDGFSNPYFLVIQPVMEAMKHGQGPGFVFGYCLVWGYGLTAIGWGIHRWLVRRKKPNQSGGELPAGHENA